MLLPEKKEDGVCQAAPGRARGRDMTDRSISANMKFELRQAAKMTVQNALLPAVYRANSHAPLQDDLVVFADAHHDKRPPAMELLARRFRKAGTYHVVELYCDYQKAGSAKVTRHVLTFMRLYARAKTVVLCDNFLPAASCNKRPGTTVLQLWHACGAFKRFGFDAPDDIPAHYHGNVYKNMDVVTVSSPWCVKPFAGAMHLPEENICPLGVSRTDLYFHEKWRQRCRDRFYEAYPEARGKKVVLWAPTFRGNAAMPSVPPLGLAQLQRELGEDYFVIAKLHPHMQSKMADASDVNDTIRFPAMPTEELYPLVDVLIADYSSLIYEYLLFRRPLVLYTPDLSEYESRRGFYMDIREIPAEIVRDEKSLAEAVKRAGSSEISTDIDTFLQKYMSGCDGKATERIFRAVTGTEGKH